MPSTMSYSPRARRCRRDNGFAKMTISMGKSAKNENLQEEEIITCEKGFSGSIHET
jgi:hypothetical protein